MIYDFYELCRKIVLKVAVVTAFAAVFSLFAANTCYAAEEEAAQTALAVEEGADSFYPAGIFSDNMVLQQNEPIVVWGNSDDEGKYVYGIFDGELVKSQVVDKKWELTFVPRAASSKKYKIEIYGSSESNYTVYENVMVGDVWLVLGQANVEYGFGEMSNHAEYEQSLNGEECFSAFYVDSEDYRRLAYGSNVLDDGSKKWYTASHPMIKNASALGVSMGLDLVHNGGNYVPIGVVSMGFDGQALSCFMPEEVAESFDGYGDKSILYNNFISKINRYAIKGVIWYQGESNAAYADEYAEGLAAFIEAFRAVRNQVNRNFPFYIIELPPCFEEPDGYPGIGWTYADFGRVRASAGRVPMMVENCYICATSDTWDNKEFKDNLYPNNKSAIAKRLALMIGSNEWNFPGYDAVFAPTVTNVKKVDDRGTVYELTYKYVVDGLKWIGEEGLGFKAIAEDYDNVNISAEIVDKDTVRITGDRPIYKILYGSETSDMFGENTGLCNSGGGPAAAFAYETVEREAIPVEEDDGADTYYPAGIFSDNMIVQQDEPIVVWGTSPNEGKYVYATLDGKTEKAQITDGQWEIRFPAMDGSPRALTLEIYGSASSKRTVYENVKVGDVWLILGQSNVEYRFGNMGDYEAINETLTGEENISVFYINSVDYKKLAYFGNNLLEGSKSWYDISHPNLINASALGLCMGLELINIGDNYTPIGVVSMGFAGQELACFVPEDLSTTFSGYGDKSLVYNNFIRHINKYPINGVIWYQGEANAAYVAEYAEGLTAFIEAFREERNQVNKNFPFYIIELPPSFDKYEGYKGNDWQYIDFGQVRAVTGSVPMMTENCYICSTSDTWSSKKFVNNLHPDNKKTIAQRLALMICSNEWNFPGYDTVFAPTVKKINKIADDGSAYELVYNHAVDGLKWNGGEGLGFKAIAEDWKYIDITVEIIGKDTVRISGNRPISRITYGSETSAMFGSDVGLCNSGGIPAAAFEYDLAELPELEAKLKAGKIPEDETGMSAFESVSLAILVLANVAIVIAVLRDKKSKKK